MPLKYLIPFAILLSACGQDPLALDENRPGLAGAPIERDLTVYGTAELTYITDNSQRICASEYDIQGWVEEEVDGTDVGCTGCSENITMAQTYVDGDCASLRARGVPTIAIMPFGFYPHDTANPSIWDWLQTETPEGADGMAEAFARSNWAAAGPRDDEDDPFDVILGVFPTAEDPIVPDGVECARTAFMRPFFIYALSPEQFGLWELNLCFVE